jgi:hypothetical protein
MWCRVQIQCDALGGRKQGKPAEVCFRIQFRACSLAVAGSRWPMCVVLCTECFLLGSRWFEERPVTAEGRFLCAEDSAANVQVARRLLWTRVPAP